MCLFAKRLEKARFVWPQADAGAVSPYVRLGSVNVSEK